MPLYEYRCESCAKEFEAYKRTSEDKGAETCPACGARSGKVGISLFNPKGTGTPPGGSSCGSGSRRSPFS